jgi:hypothetical protein
MVFAQPVAGMQDSVVQVFPSSQAVVAPPPVHWPATQVFAAVHDVSPEQDDAWQVAPSVALLHPLALFEAAQTWQAFEGLT